MTKDACPRVRAWANLMLRGTYSAAGAIGATQCDANK